MKQTFESYSPAELDEALNSFSNIYAAATALFEETPDGQRVLIPQFENGKLTQLKPERINRELAQAIIDRTDWQKLTGHLSITQQVAKKIGGPCIQIAINLAVCNHLISKYLQQERTDEDKTAMLWSIDLVFKDPNCPDEPSLPRAMQFLSAFDSEENPILKKRSS